MNCQKYPYDFKLVGENESLEDWEDSRECLVSKPVLSYPAQVGLESSFVLCNTQYEDNITSFSQDSSYKLLLKVGCHPRKWNCFFPHKLNLSLISFDTQPFQVHHVTPVSRGCGESSNVTIEPFFTTHGHFNTNGGLV
jgi:hypothetical protein